jgi:TonB family protein
MNAEMVNSDVRSLGATPPFGPFAKHYMKRHSIPILVILSTVVLCAIAGRGFQAPTRFPIQPQLVTKEIPKYPPIARAACIQGAIAVLVNVDSTGKVTAIDILYGHPLLRRSAEGAARAWTFDSSKDESNARRDFLRFVFHILPFETPEKRLKPVWSGNTDVEIKSHPAEPSCDDCSEKRRRQLRHGGCS